MEISGGTAILWRPHLATTAPSITLVAGRAQAIPFDMPGMGQVWVYTTYGHVGNSHEVMPDNDLLLTTVTNHIRSHGKPHIWGGDHNLQPEVM